MKSEVYPNFPLIFDVYEVSGKELNKKQLKPQDLEEIRNRKQAMRHSLKRWYKNEYPDRKWGELNDFEQKWFIYYTIKDNMFKLYVQDPIKQERIRKKLDTYIKKEYLNTRNALRRYNQQTEHIYDEKEDFENQVLKEQAIEKGLDPDSETALETVRNSLVDKLNKMAYEKFVKVLHDYNQSTEMKLSPPTLKEWVKNPYRIFDLEQDYKNEESTLPSNDTPFISESVMNRTLINIILKILREKLCVEVETAAVEECLKIINSVEIDEGEPLLLEYDPSLSIDKAEQETIIKRNIELQYHNEKLKKLDFYKDIPHA